jgi:hypothetical protein
MAKGGQEWPRAANVAKMRQEWSRVAECGQEWPRIPKSNKGVNMDMHYGQAEWPGMTTRGWHSYHQRPPVFRQGCQWILRRLQARDNNRLPKVIYRGRSVAASCIAVARDVQITVQLEYSVLKSRASFF